MFRGFSLLFEAGLLRPLPIGWLLLSALVLYKAVLFSVFCHVGFLPAKWLSDKTGLPVDHFYPAPSKTH
jgi:hypothetical protein